MYHHHYYYYYYCYKLMTISHQGPDKYGWVHIRPSLHDPIISMTLESELHDGIEAMVRCMVDEGLVDMMGPILDWSPLKLYLQEKENLSN